MIKKIPFHIVKMRPWPLRTSFRVLGLLFSSVLVFHKEISRFWLFFFFLILNLKVYFWWKKVIKESKEGFHNKFVLNKFYLGMLIMIISEVFFFFSFFWGFFHKCFFPREKIGSVWPPSELKGLVVDYVSIPLFKTVILLSSGLTITWAHHRLIKNKKQNFFFGLNFTVLLGVIFLFLQNFEYLNSFFRFKTLIFGSCFYMLTGFHGMHVLVGTVFLIVCLIRSLNFQFKASHHVGFVLAIWYWHFVDVVWLFLFIFVYWFSSI
jgi:heme/copper-type cytochrome/quinol oxidase subunit 3